MSKRRKKVVSTNTKETAGDSRFSVLTDEKDTYNPFKGLSVDDKVLKNKTSPSKTNLNMDKSSKKTKNIEPKKIVETFDNDVSFGDIFASWENGRSLDNVKKKTKSNNSSNSSVKKEEDFASVFSKWEKSQGIAPKEKKTPPKKSKAYKPKKDFGSLLDQFEGNNNEIKNNSKLNLKQTLKRTDLTINEADNKENENSVINHQLHPSITNTSLPKNYKVIAESGRKDLQKTLNINKTEYKNLNKGKEINNKIDTQLSKVEDTKVEDTKVIDTKVIDTKVVDAKVIDATKVEEEIDSFVSIPKKVVTENNLEELKTPKNDVVSKASVAWNVDTRISSKYSIDKGEEVVKESVKKEPLKEKNFAKSNKFKNKEQRTARASFVLSTPPADNVPSKWNFSDIYQTWANNNEEDKAIAEAKKLKEKKDNKGISISYLRSMYPEAELDLHGLLSDMAFIKTREFLERSRANGLKKVSIITGKGIHSADGIGVLRDTALSAISLSGIVREAYHPKASDGGSGVIWVIFKSTTDKKVYF